ncbi:AzlD domain-containing protein [Thermoanaerobacterium sp. DL9XJH110]|uniref:AzlD domain-containing protein n=1 Tax=Thermoanaerobacterium sp. DL9XJH110 TaxID=3386643 RepID=UPI003BB7D4C6
MSIDVNYLYLIIGMGIVTYLPRMIPAAVLSKRKIPELLIKFLSYIPAAVLSALFFPSVLMVDNKISISTSNTLLLTSLLTFPLAYKTRNMFLTVIAGMVIIVLLNRLV